MLSETISFREHGVAPKDRSVIEPGERCPLHFMRTGQEKLLTIACPGLNAQWLVSVPDFTLILLN
jgi:vacuolar protein sorting-associated protein 13A/C